MASRAAPAHADHKAVRFCPRCGHRGGELQGARGRLVIACPKCREDLYSRPARSYLEMEGFGEPADYGWPRELRPWRTEQSDPRPRPARRASSAAWLALRVSLATIVCAGLFLAISLATVAALSS
ncbi:MAG: hypothetical protein KF684_01655 [Phycisphaeraceae bacterium]|nr:hypothetical protein [Phycisphaeraceae bacterium]